MFKLAAEQDINPDQIAGLRAERDRLYTQLLGSQSWAIDGAEEQGDCTINHVPTRTCSRYASFQPAERRLFLIPSLSVVSFLSIANAVRRRMLKFASA